MRIETTIKLLVFICLLFATSVSAATTDPVPTVTELSDARPTALPLRQIDIDIKTLVAAEQTALADLNSRFEDASDQATALAVQKEIQQLRIDTQIAIFEAQVRHAERLGLTDQVKQLEASLAQMRDPEATIRALLKPELRPVPGGEK